MRRATNDTQFLYVDDMLAGINLGWDFCAEHEWGINGIKQAFGITDNPKVFGIARRTITTVPNFLVFTEVPGPKRTKHHVLVCDRWLAEHPEHLKDNHELAIWDDKGIAAAWYEGAFGVKVTAEHQDTLADVFAAFQRKDIAIYVGARGPFSNGGLKLVIVSRLPQEVLTEMEEGDRDAANLRAAAEKTGIEKYLKGKGKGWYALSPRWANEDKKEVVFWLNPFDQRSYEAGWFTVEDLRQWADDKGPVIKKR